MVKLKEQKKDIIVVIRTAGERTAELCKRLVQSQVNEDQIHVIEEKPFFKAVKKTIEIGSKSSARYLLALDGDILLYPDAVEYIIHSVNQIDFEAHLKSSFFILDEFRGKVKSGIHLYNNKYSTKFLKFLNNVDTNKYFLRPESENLKIFAKQNNLCYSYAPNHIVAKHDYFQYYKDLYAKYRLRYKRCENDGDIDSVKNYIEMKLKENPDDMDYLFVREIFNPIDSDMDINYVFHKCGIVEKDSLSEKDCDSIINSLSGNSVMKEYEREINKNMKQWIDSYESFKDFVDANFRCNNLQGNTAIYGAGNICELLLMSKNNLNIKAIIDRNVKETDSYVCEIPVIPIEQIEKFNIDNILIASIAHKDEIRERINNTIKNNNLNIILPDVV